MSKSKTFLPGESVHSYSSPHEACIVIQSSGNMTLVRAGDGREFWTANAMLTRLDF